MKETGIVIVNYNGRNYQNECLKSLYGMNNKDFDVIVVDNASTDGSVELIRTNFRNVIILEQEENVGFAAGSNIGIKYCMAHGCKYILLINNDVEVDAGLLDNLLSASRETAVAVPKIYYYKPSNQIWSAGGQLDWKRARAIHYGYRQEDTGAYDTKKEVTFGTGCCMLVPTDVFTKVGLFDELFFMYYEDTDFCARLNKWGIKIIYEPKAYMWHKVSSSTGGEESKSSLYYMFRNQLYYMHKYEKDIPLFGVLYAYCRAIYHFLGGGGMEHGRVILAAYRDYFHKRMGRKDIG